MRLLYTMLFFLFLPLVLGRLYWRGFKALEYRKRWQERLGVYDGHYSQQVIWIHAVSVGEAEAVFPLVKMLQQYHPDIPLLLTSTTPTGSARIQSLFADTVDHVYLPYDLPFVIHRFLNTFRPRMALFMEKEIWPNLYFQCGKQNIPLFIINARLSEGSAKRYQKISGFVTSTLSNITAVMAQTQEDCDRFIEIGSPADRTIVAGNIKFDVAVPREIIAQGQQLKKQLFPQRFVWLIASTHQGEDEIFMEIYRQLKTEIPELLLLIVPRHPERFQTVKHLAEQMQLKVVMRTAKIDCMMSTDVYIADTMGELKMLYAAADIVFVGGSMAPAGGHNILEPIAVGLPVMFGPHMINFKEIAEKVVQVQAAVQCKNRGEVVATFRHLYFDTEARQTLTDHGSKFLSNNQGATGRIVSRLDNEPIY